MKVTQMKVTEKFPASDSGALIARCRYCYDLIFVVANTPRPIEKNSARIIELLQQQYTLEVSKEIERTCQCGKGICHENI